MPMFRKKPVVIEAREVPAFPEPEGSVVAFVDECVALASWCGGVSHMMLEDDEHGGPRIDIKTLEGTMAARSGDYIIQGVQGEFYPCKSDIFEATYERVADDVRDSMPEVRGDEKP